MFKQKLSQSIEQGRKSLEYKIYLGIREAVFAMLDNMPSDESGSISAYWQEELAGFEYMFDASPLIVKKLRHHCYHITGLKAYDYRRHHYHRLPAFEQKLQMLQAKDKRGLLVPESSALGGFGYQIDGSLYNIDTLKFYECFIALEQAGSLEQFRNANERNIVLEIGAGWGGFAYQFKTLFSNSVYIIVDLPASILFSATYLKTIFPESRVLLAKDRRDIINLAPHNYDFIFVPHYLWTDLNFQRPDLIVNIVSFQEMTTAQLDRYIKHSAKWGCPCVYSMNRDHSPNNDDLTTVSSVMRRYYKVSEIKVLDMDYTKMPSLKSNTLGRWLTKLARRAVYGKKDKSVNKYHHLIGALK